MLSQELHTRNVTEIMIRIQDCTSKRIPVFSNVYLIELNKYSHILMCVRFFFLDNKIVFALIKKNHVRIELKAHKTCFRNNIIAI
jgi:hypothetical protein